MAPKKGRDWTEWKKEVTGMRRLGNEWKAPPEARYHQRNETTTSIALPRGFRKADHKDRNELVKWAMIFLALMFVRKIYFEMTKHERIKNSPTYNSRLR